MQYFYNVVDRALHRIVFERVNLSLFLDLYQIDHTLQGERNKKSSHNTHPVSVLCSAFHSFIPKLKM